MTNNDIKHIEATQLQAYLNTLTYRERIEFVTDVVCETNVHRQTFFNWKCMACRIPSPAKEIIERVAGQVIFSKTDYNN